jgi:hypothetical protein
MTNTVIVSDMSSVVVDTTANPIVVDRKEPVVILAGQMGPAGRSELSQMNDVDMTGLRDGGVLIYQQSNQKWTATNTLEKQILEGGQF